MEPFEDAISGRGDFARQIVLNVIMTVPFGFLYRVSSQTSTSISSEHKLLDGREEYTIHVSDGEELAVLISILNQNGSLSLTIGQSGSTPVYTGNDIESSSFTVYLRESGDYSVVIDANNHEGSYSLDWSAAPSDPAPDAPV